MSSKESITGFPENRSGVAIGDGAKAERGGVAIGNGAKAKKGAVVIRGPVVITGSFSKTD
jgi:hypothetical protein